MNPGLSSRTKTESKQDAQSALAKTRRRVVLVSLGVLMLIAVLFTLVMRSYLTEEGNRLPLVVRSNAQPQSPNYLEVRASVMGVELDTDEMLVRLEFEPRGTLTEGDDVLARKLHMRVSSDTGEALEFEPGEPMEARVVKIELSEGEVSDYPFDRYAGHFEVQVTETLAETGVQVPTPTELKFYGFHHGLHFEVTPGRVNAHNISQANFNLTRSPLVLTSVIFGMVLMWIIALMNIPFVGMVVLRMWNDRELDLFIYMTGLVVGFYFFRDALPNSPPIGTFSDYLSFFWAEAISGCSAIVLALVWMRRMVSDMADGTEQTVD